MRGKILLAGVITAVFGLSVVGIISANAVTTERNTSYTIEDIDFFLKFGNPVAIKTDDGIILMCMAIEYYERMTGEKIEIPENVKEK